MKIKKAFSLVELSVVILIIGILIAGISESGIIISKARLYNGRALTGEAPMLNIDNLILWLEPTSTKSFVTAEVKDGATISTWNDIKNSSSSDINQAIQAGSAANPTYVKSAINNLPALSFNGTSNALYLKNIALTSANYTIFVVFNPSTLDTSDREIFNIYNDSDSNFSNGNGKYGMLLEIDGGVQMRTLHRSNAMGSSGGDSNVTTTSPFNSNKNYILSYVRNLDSGTSSLWLNNVITIGAGSGVASPTVTKAAFELSPLSAAIGTLGDGSIRYFKGYIAEIIMFDRALQQDEIDDIEKYLSKKYRININ